MRQSQPPPRLGASAGREPHILGVRAMSESAQAFPSVPVPPVSADLPLAPVQSPQVWYGPDLAKRPEQWTHVLSTAEAAELRASIAAVEARGLDVVDIRAEDFPLPALGPALWRPREDLLHGRGFGVLRGVPVENATPR